MTKVADNSLVVVDRQGFDHLSGGDLVRFLGTATGSPWTGPVDLLDTAKDIRDAEDATLADGTVVATFTDRTAGGTDFAPHLKVSTDQGATFGAPIAVAHGFTGWAFVTGKVVEDAAGYLYVPLYGCDAGGVSGVDDYVRVSRSTTPGGFTFADHGMVVASGVGGRAWSEPNICPLPTAGHYVCGLRADVGAAETYMAVSTDGMATWGAPVLACAGGGRPSVHLTPEDAVVLMHRDPNGYAEVRWSFDATATWSGGLSMGVSRPMVYGSWVTLASGDLGLVWAYENVPNNDQQTIMRFDRFVYVP